MFGNTRVLDPAILTALRARKLLPGQRPTPWRTDMDRVSVGRYNPMAYVRGGAPANVARATQAAGFANPGPRAVPVPRPRIIPGGGAGRPGAGAPAVDPLWTRANDTVMQFMNPMLSRLAAARVAAEANARAAATQHGSALGQALVQSAKPMDASYDRGIVASSQVNDALANRLNAVGGAEQGDLSAKLAQIGAADTGEVQKMYQGASNAGFAHGAADLQNLIARRAEGGAYQAKLPGIGLLEGSRDLQQALGEMRQNFGEQEQGLQDQAAEQSFKLWDTFRGEKREDQQLAAQRLAEQQELYVKQKMALDALAATALTQKEKNDFAAAQKALDRQNAQTIASIRADAQMYGVDNKKFAPPKPAKPSPVTGPPNQAWISVNGKKVKNPNWEGTWKGNTPVKPKEGAAAGSPSGPQTAVTYNEIMRRIVNSQGIIRSRFAVKPDKQIASEVYKGLDLRKIPRNSPEAKKILREVFTALDGMRVNWTVDGELARYQAPEWGMR